MFKKLLRKVVNLAKHVFKEVANRMEERKSELLVVVETIADVGKKGIDSGTQLILDKRDREVFKINKVLDIFSDQYFRRKLSYVIVCLGIGLYLSSMEEK